MQVAPGTTTSAKTAFPTAPRAVQHARRAIDSSNTGFSCINASKSKAILNMHHVAIARIFKRHFHFL
ncbi:hypothetical protein L195_g061307, partial [Trifolium pratense]